jgi:hypothetical protein
MWDPYECVAHPLSNRTAYTSVRAANSAPKNATFASGGDPSCTGPRRCLEIRRLRRPGRGRLLRDQSPDFVDPDGIAEFRPGMQQGSERSVASPAATLLAFLIQLRQIGATSACLPPPRGVRCKAFSWVGLREVCNRGEGEPEPAAEEG